MPGLSSTVQEGIPVTSPVLAPARDPSVPGSRIPGPFYPKACLHTCVPFPPGCRRPRDGHVLRQGPAHQSLGNVCGQASPLLTTVKDILPPNPEPSHGQEKENSLGTIRFRENILNPDSPSILDDLAWINFESFIIEK